MSCPNRESTLLFIYSRKLIFSLSFNRTYHTQDFLLRGSLGLIAFKDALTCDNDKFEVSQNGDKVPMKVTFIIILLLFQSIYIQTTIYCF